MNVAADMEETEQNFDKLPSTDRYLKAHTSNLYLDNLEREVFEDFNTPIYSSNAAIHPKHCRSDQIKQKGILISCEFDI